MYDFDKPVNRRGTNSVKWDEMESDLTIPLWVADMDFETAPCVLDALRKRMEHGCFGYTHVPESYYQATINWFSSQHGWSGINRQWFIYTSGVVPAISAIIKAITQPGDKVLVQTPVYNCFFSSIRNNGCIIDASPLSVVETEDGPTYVTNWEDFERRCADPAVKVFVLCNPHNPAGRVWTKEELQRMGDICLRNNVFVISDEIHCEFVMPSLNPHPSTHHQHYTPFASISDDFLKHSAVCLSPSKAFNIAGLQIANIIVADEDIRKRVDKAININEVCDVNPFGVIALQAAYTDEGAAWLKELNAYIKGNYDYVRSRMAELYPAVRVFRMEGTYLMWCDVSATGMSGDEFADMMLKRHNAYVNPGSMYADSKFIRINLATQRSQLEKCFS